jgi:ketosteroid isomerase-like protein
MTIEAQIQEMIDKETFAWDNQDAEALVDIFHPDMVWPWPSTNQDHNPLEWEFTQGRYNRQRWQTRWQYLFDNYELIHNNRETLRIEISAEEDGAFAVVYVDTLWRHKETGEDFPWKGTAGKGYTLMPDGQWKLIYHAGLLEY